MRSTNRCFKMVGAGLPAKRLSHGLRVSAFEKFAERGGVLGAMAIRVRCRASCSGCRISTPAMRSRHRRC